MNDQQIKSIVRVLGVSASVVTGILVAGFGLYVYRNYVELKKSKLQIKILERELGV